MLTTEQIESLFTFCRKHFVYYYDVQVELVDHLANAVEEEMKAVPGISFEKALEKVHQTFGVMGFAPLVAEKEKIALKQGRRLFWNLFKSQFKWPKVLLFFLLNGIMFSIFSIDFVSIKWCFISIIIVGCYFQIHQSIKINRLVTKTGKKFLMAGTSQFASLIWMPLYLLYYPQIIENQLLIHAHSFYTILILSLFISLFIILIIAIAQTLSSVKTSLYKNYPEVFSVIE